ncbi:DUF3800 domain-containing protein [Massilia violaceinigra]|uniref:DUF3800 domain-containing protein n=1 Tax=Massilia violaceinigra TaxID=2045208 RepID=A0ABY4A3V2_9BURK|nr:DUF3800 domain-containing protein [Massilia violaceinigra]UOD27353.1 DUF3800 domain-containing protein [Massilia violaceinigra]
MDVCSTWLTFFLRATKFGGPLSLAERKLTVHLLYVDESGSVTDASQRYFVLAGVSVFERTTHWIELALDKIARKADPITPDDRELHGSPMRSGKGFWRQFDLATREGLIKEVLNAGVMQQQKGVRLFACVVEKSAIAGRDPVELCFEQIAMSFDLFLQRCHTRHQDTQRGMMLFDESSTEKQLQKLAREFKHNGHTFGKTRNYAEVPVFLDSRASRLIQLADVVAYSIFRHFEHADSQYWDILKDRFDVDDGVKHGFMLCDTAHPLSSFHCTKGKSSR